MNLPKAGDIQRFHDEYVVDRARAGSERPLNLHGLWRWIEVNHHCNCLLWEQEDQARRTDVPEAAIAGNKRTIDRHNQSRNDAIEKIDESLLESFAGVAKRSDARLNSETAGAIVDRLSILSLKIHHMRLQTERTDVGQEHVEACRAKLVRMIEQRNDLIGCLDRLLAECAGGSAYFKVYRQFKMYNDPNLNPYLYKTDRWS